MGVYLRIRNQNSSKSPWRKAMHSEISLRCVTILLTYNAAIQVLDIYQVLIKWYTQNGLLKPVFEDAISAVIIS